MERARFTGRDNIERERWSVIADSVITARPASGRGKRREEARAGQSEPAQQPRPQPAQGGELTEDDIRSEPAGRRCPPDRQIVAVTGMDRRADGGAAEAITKPDTQRKRT